jgi:hypothetical protein
MPIPEREGRSCSACPTQRTRCALPLGAAPGGRVARRGHHLKPERVAVCLKESDSPEAATNHIKSAVRIGEYRCRGHVQLIGVAVRGQKIRSGSIIARYRALITASVRTTVSSSPTWVRSARADLALAARGTGNVVGGVPRVDVQFTPFDTLSSRQNGPSDSVNPDDVPLSDAALPAS